MLALRYGWKKYLLFTSALFLVVGLGTGCRDNSSKSKGSGKGGDVKGQITFTFDGTKYSSTNCLAHYMVSDTETSITAGDGETWTLTLEFPGKSKGSFSKKKGASAGFVLPPLNQYNAKEFKFTVSAYGGIGGAIKGTFSGTMVNNVDKNDVKQITNGTFTAKRGADIP